MVVYVSLSAPEEPVPSTGETTGTSITITWSQPSGTEVESFVVMWDGGMSEVLSADTMSYTIEGLEEGRTYTITVTATNAAGTSEIKFTASTTAGLYTQPDMYTLVIVLFSIQRLHHPILE